MIRVVLMIFVIGVNAVAAPEANSSFDDDFNTCLHSGEENRCKFDGKTKELDLAIVVDPFIYESSEVQERHKHKYKDFLVTFVKRLWHGFPRKTVLTTITSEPYYSVRKNSEKVRLPEALHQLKNLSTKQNRPLAQKIVLIVTHIINADDNSVWESVGDLLCEKYTVLVIFDSHNFSSTIDLVRMFQQRILSVEKRGNLALISMYEQWSAVFYGCVCRMMEEKRFLSLETSGCLVNKKIHGSNEDELPNKRVKRDDATTSTVDPEGARGNTLSPGTRLGIIIGASVGGFVFLVVAVVIVVVIVKRRGRHKKGEVKAGKHKEKEEKKGGGEKKKDHSKADHGGYEMMPDNPSAMKRRDDSAAHKKVKKEIYFNI